MSVPLREADAATLPGWFSATQAISLWWALMVKGADDVPGLVLDKSYRKQKIIFLSTLARCVRVSSAYNQLQAAALVAWKDQQLLLQTGA